MNVAYTISPVTRPADLERRCRVCGRPVLIGTCYRVTREAPDDNHAPYAYTREAYTCDSQNCAIDMADTMATERGEIASPVRFVEVLRGGE